MKKYTGKNAEKNLIFSLHKSNLLNVKKEDRLEYLYNWIVNGIDISFSDFELLLKVIEENT
jgi:hypothetical protein